MSRTYRLPQDSRSLIPETGGMIDPYRDQTVLDYLQSKRPTSTPTSVGGGYDTFLEDQPSTVSSIPALDESYSVAERDIQEEASDQILEQIRLNALSEEAWNIEKNKLIQADNKMELAVALATGTQPNLTRLDVSTWRS